MFVLHYFVMLHEFGLQGCDTVHPCRWVPVLRINLLPQSAGSMEDTGWYPFAKLHSVTSYKTIFFTVGAVKTINLTL
jgi:hypothetical protein